jgi:hypothetical protein
MQTMPDDYFPEQTMGAFTRTDGVGSGIGVMLPDSGHRLRVRAEGDSYLVNETIEMNKDPLML